MYHKCKIYKISFMYRANTIKTDKNDTKQCYIGDICSLILMRQVREQEINW